MGQEGLCANLRERDLKEGGGQGLHHLFGVNVYHCLKGAAGQQRPFLCRLGHAAEGGKKGIGRFVNDDLIASQLWKDRLDFRVLKFEPHDYTAPKIQLKAKQKTMPPIWSISMKIGTNYLSCECFFKPYKCQEVQQGEKCPK